MTIPSKRLPSERGQGRKSLDAGGKSPVIQVRVSQALKDKVQSKGAQWVRDVLTNAK